MGETNIPDNVESESGPSPQFKQTRWSLVRRAAGLDSPESREALEALCRLYWFPIYAFVRRQAHSPHDAQDLTQEFFARLLASNSIARADQRLGKFRPGEVRTCANCHGINADVQLGLPPPTNAPFALRQLLRFWRTNSANAYSLVVSNGTCSGNFGAGSILNITANPGPSGKYFAGWSGGSVLNPGVPATSGVMPTNDLVVTALHAQLPAPVFNSVQMIAASSNLLVTAHAFTNQIWILQASPDLNTWADIATNPSDSMGLLQFMPTADPAQTRQFYRLRSP